MEKLVRGLHEFHSTISESERELIARLAKGQNPEVLFITCSDSRVVPNMITRTDPGDLFVMRNAGNLVPAYGAAASGESGTIEFAVAGLKVKDIVVCGHTSCGAIQGLFDPAKVEGLPAVKSWLQNAETTRRVVQENYAHLSKEKQVRVGAQENVLVQLENLRTHPAVAARLARGDLKLHAWMYRLDDAQVFSFDPASGQYQQLVRSVQLGNGSNGSESLEGVTLARPNELGAA